MGGRKCRPSLSGVFPSGAPGQEKGDGIGGAQVKLGSCIEGTSAQQVDDLVLWRGSGGTWLMSTQNGQGGDARVGEVWMGRGREGREGSRGLVERVYAEGQVPCSGRTGGHANQPRKEWSGAVSSVWEVWETRERHPPKSLHSGNLG